MGYSSNVANLVVRKNRISRDITSNRLDRLKLRRNNGIISKGRYNVSWGWSIRIRVIIILVRVYITQ